MMLLKHHFLTHGILSLACSEDDPYRHCPEATAKSLKPIMDDLAESSYRNDPDMWFQLLQHFGDLKKGCPKGVRNSVYTHWYLSESGSSFKVRLDQDL